MPEPLQSFFMITCRFFKSFFAFSHRGTGLFSQPFDSIDGNFDIGAPSLDEAGGSQHNYKFNQGDRSIMIVMVLTRNNDKEKKDHDS